MTLRNALRETKGFTLIELLVVIVIIGILATSAVQIFSNAQAKARDSQRTTDLSLIQSALEQYYTENDEYPSTVASIASLSGYFSKWPVDPKYAQGTGLGKYVYAYSVWNGANGVNNQVYALSARFEKNKMNKPATNPGLYVVSNRLDAMTVSTGKVPTCNDTTSICLVATPATTLYFLNTASPGASVTAP